jgi:hypothetical protein
MQVNPSGNSALVEDITRLWRANLSEDFIDKYITRSNIAKDLTAEDVVRLRSEGVPETLISKITMLRNDAGTQAGMQKMLPASRHPARWDGLVRRNSGLVLFKSRWDSGVLEFKDSSISWRDSKDIGKNLLVPAAQVTEQQLTCLKKSGGNECFEWVLMTKGEEYRFRDVGWRQGENAKVDELFTFFKETYPSMISSRTPVDEK